MRFQLCKVVLVPDGIHVGSVPMVDGVSFFVVGQTPAVVHAVKEDDNKSRGRRVALSIWVLL